MNKHYRILFILLALIQLSIQSHAQQARSNHIELAKSNFHLTDNDLTGMLLTHSHTSKKSGITHYYYQQTFNDIAIRGANMDIHTKENKVLKISSLFIKNIEEKVEGKPDIDARQALTNAALHTAFPLPDFPKIHQKKQANNRKTIFDHTGIALEPIEAELVYILNKRKKLRLAWELSLYELSGHHWWLVTVDAETGEVITQEDRVLHCEFSHTNTLNSGTQDTCTEEYFNSSKYINPTDAMSQSVADGSSYNVYPIRIESPSHGGRLVVNQPADVDASPFGWHDVNGVAGAEYTNTRGNNTFAYDDADGNNNTPGGSPNGGASLDFNFPIDLNNTPSTNLDASITNLFYWNNLMHDVWYHYGFDEAAGNYQTNNYGRGGTGGDFVLAEAQDGSGTNNANFSPGVDGGNGRMQMFLWNNIQINLKVGDTTYEASGAQFGPRTFDINGSLVIADDDSADPTQACNALTPANAAQMSGKIALIDRGSCNFTVKVANAQAAGAIGVVICSQDNILLNQMGGVDNTITIPSILIKQSDCAVIRAQIPTAPVNVSAASGQSDSSLDNGIIAHEYGHGISNRLTGGAANSNCLNNEEQAGEGWSDWWGLVMTVKVGDTGPQRRGVGTYSIGQVTTGTGIRRYPYSTDMSINPHTYNDIKTEVVPHGVGSVWCAMIWDLYWNLIDVYGYDTDMYRGTGGNNIAMDLVMEGLKLQSCNPGFIDARDAILLADQALYNGDNECLIWQTFARRGLGFSASQGSSGRRSDGTEAFDLPPGMNGVTVSKSADKTQVYPNDIINFTLKISGGRCYDDDNIKLVDSLPAGLKYIQGSASNNATHNNNVLSWSTIPSLAKDASLTYTYQAIVDSNYIAPAWDTLFYDDMENGSDTWSLSNASNRSNWTRVDDPICGTTAWYAIELEAGTTIEHQYLTMPLTTIGADAELTFTHRYDTEPNWDGGKVELSENGGINWTDLGPYMTQNGYNDYIRNNPANLAFADDSGGCIETKVDLSSFAGDEVLIRFNFYYDQGVPGEGWYIDNVYLAGNSAVVNTAHITSNRNVHSDYVGIEIITCTPIELYANLEGAYDATLGEMTTILNTEQGLLPGQTPLGNLSIPTPAGQPYGVAPWNYNGTEGAGWTDANYTEDIVDWVLLSLRSDEAKNTEILQTAALLYKDGSIKPLDKCLINTTLDKGSLYAVIQHRNHIGVMSPVSVDMSTGILSHDFRIADSYKDIASFGQKKLNSGAWTMYAGDIDQSDMPSYDIIGTDKVIWVEDNGNFGIYLPSDVNLDGDINGEDKAFWENNNGISSRVPK